MTKQTYVITVGTVGYLPDCHYEDITCLEDANETLESIKDDYWDYNTSHINPLTKLQECTVDYIETGSLDIVIGLHVQYDDNEF